MTLEIAVALVLIGLVIGSLLLRLNYSRADLPQYTPSQRWPGRVRLTQPTTCHLCHAPIAAGENVRPIRHGRAVIGCCCRPIGGLL